MDAAGAYAKKVIIADLDDTLAISKAALDEEMAEILCELLAHTDFAIISGGSYVQFQKQVIGRMKCAESRLSHLYLFPTNATAFYRLEKNEWKEVYTEHLSPDERARIIDAFRAALEEAKFEVPERLYGPQIEDRETQITFSALGQAAPYDAKVKWDPTVEKRQRIKACLEKLIPEFQIGIGGKTSIDVTRKGRDKAYGIRKIGETLACSISEMLYIGDALFEGGNDYPAKLTGVDCIAVKSAEDTKKVLRGLIAAFAGKGDESGGKNSNI